MKTSLLNVNNLQVTVEAKTVINGLNLNVDKGEVVALMGPNGSGKSSLAMTLMGDSRYKVEGSDGQFDFDGNKLLDMSSDERSRMGLYNAWQNPISIPGVSVFRLCKSSYEAHGHKISALVAFKKRLEDLAIKVGLTKDHVSRNVNEGFSGGERKRLELLQLLLLKPKLAILDEIDSGLDIDGLKMVSEIVNEMKIEGTAFILITHYKKMLDYIAVDRICVMKAGKIDKTGGIELGALIEEKGYGKISTRV